MPATLSLLTNVFRDSTERGRAIGVWAAVAGGGSAIGPVIGGFLLAHFWWGSVFLINVPVAAGALIAGRFLLPPSRDPSAPRLDPVGALLSMAGLVAVLWGIIEAPTQGWSSPLVLGSLVVGLLVVAGFVGWELHSDHPMLDVRFFKNRRFTAANAAITMVYFALFGSMFVITQYLQNVLGYSAFQAGLRHPADGRVMLVVAPSAPRLVERVGTKLVVGGGLLIVVVGLGFAATTTTGDGYLHLVAAMSMVSVGMGLVLAPATESIMGSLPPSKAGVGSAMNDTTRQMGGALGVAVVGSVLASSYRPGVTSRLAPLHLPAGVLHAAQDSVGAAVTVAKTLPAAMGAAVTAAAHAQFVESFGGALLVGGAVVLLAAVVVFAFLPARAHDAREPFEGPLDGLASLTFAEAEGVLETDAADLAAGREPADGRELAGKPTP